MNTRLVTFFAAVMAFLFTSASFAGSGSDLNGNWSLKEIFIKGMEIQKRTTLTFDNDRYYMFAGCNRFFGSYDKTVVSGKIKINHGASTKKYCSGDYERQFSKVLYSADRYEIKNNHLILYSNGKKIMKF